MWATFPVTLLFFSILTEALQHRAEDGETTFRRRTNFTEDVVFEEEHGRETVLVARVNPPRPTGLKGIINRINPFKPGPPPYEVLPSPQNTAVVVSLKQLVNYRLASIKIGTSPPLDVVVHTDSPCFWTAFNPGKSKSRRNQPEVRPMTCDSRLLDASTVVGDVYLGHISIGEMKQEGSVLGVMEKPNNLNYGGELGLALPPRCGKPCKETSFLDFISKRFRAPVFALRLTSTGGELHIGRPLAQHYEGIIEYHRIVKTSVFRWRRWQIGQAVIGLNGDETVLSNKIQTVFDSTLPFIYGPPEQVKEIYEAIRGHNRPMSPGYDYAFPCEKQVEVHFRWKKGQAWTISPERFNRGLVSAPNKPQMCKGIIRMHGGVGGEWIMGISFMVTLYLVFDGTPGHERVGLAHSALPPLYEKLGPGPPNYSSAKG